MRILAQVDNPREYDVENFFVSSPYSSKEQLLGHSQIALFS